MRTLLRCFSFIRTHRGKMVLAFLCTLGHMFFFMCGIGMIMMFVHLLDGQQAIGETSIGKVLSFVDVDLSRYSNAELHPWVCLIGAISIVMAAVFMFPKGLLPEVISVSVGMDAQNRLAQHLLSLPLSRVEGRTQGSVMARLATDVQALRLSVRSFIIMITEPVMVIGFIGFLLILNWKLTLIGLGAIAVGMGPITILSMRLRKYAARSAKRNEELMQNSLQVLSGFRTIVVYGAEEREHENYAKTNFRLCRALFAALRVRAGIRTLSEALMALGVVLVLYIGGLIAFAGDGLALGDLIGFILTLAAMGNPVRKAIRCSNEVQNLVPYAARVFELLDEKSDLVDASDARALDDARQPVAFQNVSFSYGEEPVLTDVSFTAEPGQTIGIAGRSGTGKSSLLNLIPRLYDPVAGRITVGGQDIRGVTMASLRRHISVVTQEPFLFNTTVRENIRYGRADASDEEVEAAAGRAHIHDEIMGFDRGYDTVVGERGARISGGQKQRIAIARAMLRDAPILILDEATSNLDSESEARVQQALNALVGGRTTFVIAHRLSTIRDADKIVVLAEGRVEAAGTHAELLTDSPTYAQLWRMQSE